VRPDPGAARNGSLRVPLDTPAGFMPGCSFAGRVRGTGGTTGRTGQAERPSRPSTGNLAEQAERA